mgnify:CR=1 FL=1
MPLISEQNQTLLRDKFAKDLTNKVNITLFTQAESPLTVPGQECMYCKETRELLEEIAGLSDKISLRVRDFVADSEEAKQSGVDKIPAIIIGDGASRGVRYFGIPSGYEFASLIEDIVEVSRGDTELSADIKSQLAKIDQDVHIQVFVTPTCPYCPGAARVAHQMAIENPHFTSDVIEAMEFPHLAQKYRVMAVPKIVINDKIEFQGSVPADEFLRQVLQAIPGQAGGASPI